jgi:hypothetical protein
MRRSLLLVGAFVLLITGCRAEANIALDVEEDGSGAVTAEFGVDEELMELLSQAGSGPEEMFDFIPEGENVETRVDGDMTFYAISQPFADTEELDEVLADLEDTDSQFADVELVVGDDGGATLDATLIAPDTAEAADSLGGGALDIGDDVFSARFFASLPGTVEESNADEVLADGRLAWDIPFEGGEVDIHVVTTGDGSGLPVGAIIALVAGILLIAGGAIWAARRRRSSHDALAATAVPEPPQPIFGQTPSETDPPDPTL